MEQRFEGKTVLVTGGSSGIGLAAARAFAAEGAQVVITGRDQANLQQAAAEIGALALQCDVADVKQIEASMETLRRHLNRIDVLFVNAGTAAILPIEKVTEEIWDRVVDVNLKGVYFTIQAALPLMRRGSVIVLNASLGARRSPPHMSVYAATKAGVVALGRTLAIEFAERGIRVNVLSSGPIETPLPQRTLGVNPTALPQLLDPKTCTPMGRIGHVDEVAAAVLFLSSDASSFITGVDLLVDGGIAAS